MPASWARGSARPTADQLDWARRQARRQPGGVRHHHRSRAGGVRSRVDDEVRHPRCDPSGSSVTSTNVQVRTTQQLDLVHDHAGDLPGDRRRSAACSARARSPTGPSTSTCNGALDRLGQRDARRRPRGRRRSPVAAVGSASTRRCGTVANDIRLDNFGGGELRGAGRPGVHPEPATRSAWVSPYRHDPGGRERRAAASVGRRPGRRLPGRAGLTNPRANPRGAYYENLIVTTPVKLQGVGPGGIRGSQTVPRLDHRRRSIRRRQPGGGRLVQPRSTP